MGIYQKNPQSLFSGHDSVSDLVQARDFPRLASKFE